MPLDETVSCRSSCSSEIFYFVAHFRIAGTYANRNSASGFVAGNYRSGARAFHYNIDLTVLLVCTFKLVRVPVLDNTYSTVIARSSSQTIKEPIRGPETGELRKVFN